MAKQPPHTSNNMWVLRVVVFVGVFVVMCTLLHRLRETRKILVRYEDGSSRVFSFTQGECPDAYFDLVPKLDKSNYQALTRMVGPDGDYAELDEDGKFLPGSKCQPIQCERTGLEDVYKGNESFMEYLRDAINGWANWNHRHGTTQTRVRASLFKDPLGYQVGDTLGSPAHYTMRSTH